MTSLLPYHRWSQWPRCSYHRWRHWPHCCPITFDLNYLNVTLPSSTSMTVLLPYHRWPQSSRGCSENRAVATSTEPPAGPPGCRTGRRCASTSTGFWKQHYNDVIMGAIASQFTSLHLMTSSWNMEDSHKHGRCFTTLGELPKLIFVVSYFRG